MKTIVIYESFFGNTQIIAESIAKHIGSPETVELINVNNIDLDSFSIPEVLVVGSPTRGFRPCPGTKEFLKSLAPQSLKGVYVAAFDTRAALHEIKNGFLRFIVKTGGYADKHVEKALKKKGGKVIFPSDGFCVEDTEGPLLEGEIRRAVNWAEAIRSKLETEFEKV